jgi:hypothetical protein
VSERESERGNEGARNTICIYTISFTTFQTPHLTLHQAPHPTFYWFHTHAHAMRTAGKAHAHMHKCRKHARTHTRTHAGTDGKTLFSIVFSILSRDKRSPNLWSVPLRTSRDKSSAKGPQKFEGAPHLLVCHLSVEPGLQPPKLFLRVFDRHRSCPQPWPRAGTKPSPRGFCEILSRLVAHFVPTRGQDCEHDLSLSKTRENSFGPWLHA